MNYTFFPHSSPIKIYPLVRKKLLMQDNERDVERSALVLQKGMLIK